MTIEKQSTGYPAALADKPYYDMGAPERAIVDSYFDERWPLFTARNLLGAAGIGAGATGLYHLIRHFTAEAPSQAHQNFYAGPKMFADKRKKQPVAKTAEVAPAAEPPKMSDPPVWHDPRPGVGGAWLGLGNIAGPVLSGIGGAYLMNKLVRGNKRKNYNEEIEAARQEYERALTEKMSVLHDVYAANREKIAQEGSNWAQNIGKFLTQKLPYLPVINQALKGYNAYATGAGALSAALGGKLVYDLTRQRSNAEVLRRAQDARARLSSLPPLWVTPDDVVPPSQEEQEVPAPRRKAASA